MSRGPAKPTPTVQVEPGLLDEDRAAEFLSRSPSWLRAARQADVARVKRGEQPTGPAWIVIDRSVFYRPEDLRRWIADRAVLRGVVNFDRRQPAEALGGES